MQRKLAAILVADVVEYSRLMGDDEEATLNMLRVSRGVIETLVEKHSGRVFAGAGDSALAEFASPVEALRCAVEIQQEIDNRNTDVPEARRMRFRIGVNLGDVMVEEGNLYGDGVNVAARLESLAEHGGICISHPLLEQVRNKMDLGYEYLGEQEAKNIAEPVRAYRVILEPEAAGVVLDSKAKRTGIWRWAAAALTVMLVVAGGNVLWLKLRDGTGQRKSGDPWALSELTRPTRHFRVERPAHLSSADALTIYDRIRKNMVAAYGKSANWQARAYHTWRRYNVAPYLSATHGKRYVNNYANALAKAYGKFEMVGILPEGSVLAKDSFEVTDRGDIVTGPLSLMEKMQPGFNLESRDWRYTLIMPDGSVFGITKGARSEGVQFCVECHIAAGDKHDHLFFIPDQYRTRFHSRDLPSGEAQR